MLFMGRTTVLFLLFAVLASAQKSSSCNVTFPAFPGNERNIFTPRQEVDLGDALADSSLLDIRIVATNDPVVQRIAERLVKSAPFEGLNVRTFIIDLPVANAFVLPGGRVYIARALIALLENEDELAGILSHEFGHLLAHQQAIRLSRLLKDAVHVTSVGDTKDIADKLSRMNENLWQLAGNVPDRSQQDQIEADRLGLLIQTASGYDPKAQIRAFDRLAETGGKGGNVITNFFSFQPNRQRVGEMLKNSPPSGCAAATSRAAAEDFAEWRKRILSDAAAAPVESLSRVKSRVQLKPPLRGDLSQLRFSPNGRFILAQDPLGITVLTVQPFAVSARIRVEATGPATFTQDSKEIILANFTGRVDRWDSATGRLVQTTQLPLRRTCSSQLLAPDGHTLACLSGSLQLFDVESGTSILEKKAFQQFSVLRFFEEADNEQSKEFDYELNNSGPVPMQFSPDSRYFLAVSNRANNTLVWDLKEAQAVPVKGELKKLPGQYFTFLTPDRIIMAPANNKLGANQTAAVVSFPAGDILEKPTLPSGPMSRTANAAFVRIAPMGKVAAGLVDYAAGDVITNQAAALDINGRTYIAERSGGELALYERGKGVIARTTLPDRELSSLRAFSVSPDLARLAISAGVRGGVWDLSTGQAVAQFGSFDGAYLDTSGRFLADIPKADDRARHMVDVRFNPPASQMGPEVKSAFARQAGPWIIDIHREDQKPVVFDEMAGRFVDIVLEVYEASTMKSAWSRKFAGEAPNYFFEPTGEAGVLLWTGLSDRVKRDSSLRHAFATTPNQEEQFCFIDLLSFTSRPYWNLFGHERRPAVYLAETFQASNGKIRDSIVVNLVDRCRTIKDMFPLRGAVAVTDRADHTMVYAGTSGQPTARIAGRILAAEPNGVRLAVGKDRGHLIVYDGLTGAILQDARFNAPVVRAQFAADDRLFVFTSRQEAVVLDVSGR